MADEKKAKAPEGRPSLRALQSFVFLDERGAVNKGKVFTAKSKKESDQLLRDGMCEYAGAYATMRDAASLGVQRISGQMSSETRQAAGLFGITCVDDAGK